MLRMYIQSIGDTQNLTRYGKYGSKNSGCKSLEMGVISDMMAEDQINLKEASFKFIRKIFALDFEYKHSTLKKKSFNQ